MQITSEQNLTNFKALEYTKTPVLEKVLNTQKAEVKDVLKNAKKELKKIQTKLVISEAGEGILTHYVDIGKKGLTYIDCAKQDNNILQVYGYSYDKDGSALQHTAYICCEIPLSTPEIAETYMHMINTNPYIDMTANLLNKAVITAKAMDEII